MPVKLFLLLVINLSFANIKELNSVKWSEIGLRIICPFDEFQMKFTKIKHEFKHCLNFKHILLDVEFPTADLSSEFDENYLEEIEEEKEIQKHFAAITYSKNKMLNPFCKLSKYWNNCIKYVLPFNCLEPNSKSLVPVYLPRTVQEQLRRVYDLHAKQSRTVQSFEEWNQFPHSGNHEQINDQDEELRQKYFYRQRQLKLEQLTDYYKFRCDQRVQLHIDSLDLPKSKSNAPPIDRFQQEAFSDIF